MIFWVLRGRSLFIEGVRGDHFWVLWGMGYNFEEESCQHPFTMPTPTIIEIDLREVLAEMNKKLDRIDDNINGLKDDINGLKIEFADVKGDIKALDQKVSSLDKRLEKVEGSQNRQIWALIGILFTGIVGVIIRFVLMGLPTT